MPDDPMIKLHIDLPNHWATGGESFWAAPLGDDLYEVRNVIFHAYDINFLDVVKAVAKNDNLKPEVLEVVRRRGHETLRVFFSEESEVDERLAHLKSLADLHVEFENANSRLFALDILPAGDVNAVRDRLDAWAETGLLEYETCEARVPGSFDGRVEED